MYNMTTAFKTAAEANARQILTKAVFNDSVELTGDNIIDMTVTEAVSTSNGISMGSTISAKLTLTFKMPETPLVLSGGWVEPYAGFYGVDEYCPLGKFYITEIESKKDSYTITAYDGFSKTETIYEPEITMPNTASAILNDIAKQCNFELDENISLPDGNFNLYSFTCRQYIGYLAGMAGKNAKFNRLGKLTFSWYTAADCTITYDLQYMGGFKRLTDGDFVVKSITSGTDTAKFTSGTGPGFSFENPFMTQEKLDAIASAIGNPSFTPSTVKWRGNPAIEAGDIISATDGAGVSYQIYVMEQSLRISGGLNSEIKCYGATEASIQFDSSPQAKRLHEVYNKLQEAVAEATKLLNGANGGIFEILDEDADGINDGWIIHSADKQQFIKANVNGIGITTDGGTTYKQAMTPEGINADIITTGEMHSQRVSVGDSSLGDVFSVEKDENNDIVVTIGSSKSDIKQRQTNDAITFIDANNKAIAQFSTTGASWDDLQEMRYCGFVWTKSDISGNVRFTKARG